MKPISIENEVSDTLEVDGELRDGELYMAMDVRGVAIAAMRMPVNQVEMLRDHLTKILELENELPSP